MPVESRALVQSEPDRSLLIQAEAAYQDAVADPKRGWRRAEDVIARARYAGDIEALVVGLRAAASAARELLRQTDAVTLLSEAAALARHNGLHDRLSEVLVTSSSVNIELGRPHLARRDIAAARAVTGSRSAAEVAFGEGVLFDKTGDFVAAAAAYRRALLTMEADRSLLRVKTLNNLALAIAKSGRYQEAEGMLEEAIRIAAREGLDAREGIVTESYAFIAVEDSRPVDALRRYDRAEEILTRVNVQLVDLYLGKAKALLSLRLLAEAAQAASRAVDHVEGTPGGSMMLAEALLPQARIALAQRRFDAAVAVAVRAEGMFRRQRRAGWRVLAALIAVAGRAYERVDDATLAKLDRIERTMIRIGNRPGAVEAALLQGDLAAACARPRKARAAYTRAAAAARTGPVLLRLQGRVAAARQAELDGDGRRISAVCRIGLEELAAYRASIASAELRARAAGYGTRLADIGLRDAVRSGRPERVWAWLERSQSVSFATGAPVVDDRLRPLLAELRALESEHSALAPEEAIEGAAVLRRVAAVERRIRDISWTGENKVDAWASPTARALSELRDGLAGRLLLQYGLVDGSLCAVAVRNGRTTIVELGPIAPVVASGAQLGFALRRLSQRRGSRAGQDAAFTAARHEVSTLARMLLGPVEDIDRDHQEIVVVPPGELIGLPWGSLPGISDRPVRVVPSAMSWWLSRGSAVDGPIVLAAGPDVPSADAEIAEIAELYLDPVRLPAAAATVEAVWSAAGGARTVHIAAHGRLRSDSPTFSSVQLADGPLTVHDLEGLQAPAHHWILAACDLGRPGSLAGPALEGVLATLLSSGSGAVIAATVSVPDLDTRQVMVELHRCLAAGESMAESLRRARTAVDPSSPTGFVAGTAFSCYGGG